MPRPAQGSGAAWGRTQPPGRAAGPPGAPKAWGRRWHSPRGPNNAGLPEAEADLTWCLQKGKPGEIAGVGGSERRVPGEAVQLPPAGSSWRMLGQTQRRPGLLTRRPSKARGTNQVCLPEGLGLGYLQDKELGSRARGEHGER